MDGQTGAPEVQDRIEELEEIARRCLEARAGRDLTTQLSLTRAARRYAEEAGALRTGAHRAPLTDALGRAARCR